MRAALAAGLSLLSLAACQAATEPQPAASVPSATPTVVASPAPNTFAVRADRDTGDMIAGCPHQNPEQRPRGSNCFGIFPEQCGADRAAAYVGQSLTPEKRRDVEAIAPPGGIRFIRPAEPVTDDLRFGRLNVLLDTQGRIDKVDCY